METWNICLDDMIPEDEYCLHLQQGERQGLVIFLEGKHHNILLNFGNVQAVNILDEGTQLNGPQISNHAQLRAYNFASTIYLVENGAYENYIKSLMSPTLYENLNLRQYNIVTLNYVVEIIAYSEPTITIAK